MPSPSAQSLAPMLVRRLCPVLFVLVHALAAAAQALAPAPEVPWLADGAAQARLAVRLLGQAGAHGLNPERYGAADLARRLDAQRDAAAEIALERDLGKAMLRYLEELHAGRTPSAYRAPDREGAADLAPLLAQAVRAGRLEQLVDDAAPAFPLYRRVMASLAHYRALARLHPDWPPLPAAAGGVAAGDRYPGAASLGERLQVLGDLDAAPAGGDIYTEELAAALRRFQARHGLAEDGVLGPQTLAALAVPPRHRAAQLALTLERLRWLPPLPPGRAVAVNLPAYRLWAFDSSADADAPPLEMRIIVGTAAKTPTPLFIGQMRYLELNPYWNVPRSIALGEILPKLARDSAYLARNDMELVGPDGRVIAHPDAALAALRAGTARIRQRPGERNALGALKFAMPNPMNIYLHSTSAKELFERRRRDLSHGCIRVEHPVALAQFVLADTQAWHADAIEAAIRSGKTRTVALPAPVPVVLFYATAITERDGRIVFAEDIYGRDGPLLEALARP
ncbi:murein L,D-transpeptidase [Massilia jejuensis]|uniref:Murein L,D-transpeptidase n=1 Tax=Massilia jejuensis TaxID=648894 RepID=A0ABW0PD16_9BURK